MLADRVATSLPDWLERPLSIVTALSALAGAACLFAAAMYGSYTWLVVGIGAFALSGLLWQITDRLAARR